MAFVDNINVITTTGTQVNNAVTAVTAALTELKALLDETRLSMAAISRRVDALENVVKVLQTNAVTVPTTSITTTTAPTTTTTTATSPSTSTSSTTNTTVSTPTATTTTAPIAGVPAPAKTDFISVNGQLLTGPPKVGDVLRATNPFDGSYHEFKVAKVVANQAFSNNDSALMLNVAYLGNGTVYYNCTFHAGRYAVWANNQNSMAFISCYFEDDLDRSVNPSWGQGDESTVRLEDCNDIYFQNCTIRAHGAKHGFRVHGLSQRVGVSGMRCTTDGNGMMFGKYIGATAPALVQDLWFDDLQLTAPGPDPFDPKHDGTLLRFYVRNSCVRYSATQGYDPAADAPNADWKFVNFTSVALP